jgi:AMMECR1 domain-containing protein
VTRSELRFLRVEITLLGALTRLPNEVPCLLEGLDPRECGLYLRGRGRTGLLLPQVARRLGWDAEELLDQVSLKAGLDGNVWKDPRTELYGFRARTLAEVRPEAFVEPPT